MRKTRWFLETKKEITIFLKIIAIRKIGRWSLQEKEIQEY